MDTAKNLALSCALDLEALVEREFPATVFPGPPKALVKSAIEDFARRECALPDSEAGAHRALEADVRRRIESHDALHSLFWQQHLTADHAHAAECDAFMQAAQVHGAEIFRRRGDDLLTYVARYDRPETPLPFPSKFLAGTSLPRALSEIEYKHAWYAFEAILEFLLLVANDDRTLKTWPEYARRPGTRLDRLGRVLKDRVKYTPENLEIIRQMRSVHGWNVVLNIGQVLDSSRYTHVEGVSMSSMERAIFSQMLSVLQGKSGGVHIWPRHIGLLMQIAKGKARDYANEELRKRGVVIPLIAEPAAPDDDSTDSDEIDQLLARAEEIGNEHIFEMIAAYRSKSSGVDGRIVTDITQGQSTIDIAKALKTTKARVYAVAKHFEEFLEKQIVSQSLR